MDETNQSETIGYNITQKTLFVLFPTYNLTFTDGLEELYEMLNHTYLNTLLHVILLVPTAALGFILNILGFFVFSKNEFKLKPIYSYLRVIFLTGIVSNFFEIFYGVFVSRCLIQQLGNSYFASFYLAHIHTSLNSTCNLYRNVIDIIVVLDRITMFRPKVKRFLTRFSPTRNSAVLLVCTCTVNIPSRVFLFTINCLKIVQINQQQDLNLFNFYIAQNSNFSESLEGQVLKTTFVGFRNLLPLILEISLNIYSTILYREFLRRKHTIKSLKTYTNNNNNNNNNTNQRLKAGVFNPDRNLFYMAFILSLISIVNHVFNLIFFFENYISIIIPGFATFLAQYSTVLKHAINFNIFHSFNKKFRRAFHKMLDF